MLNKIIPFRVFINGVAEAQKVTLFAALVREYDWWLTAVYPEPTIPMEAYAFHLPESESYVEAFLECYMCREREINEYMAIFKRGMSEV